MGAYLLITLDSDSEDQLYTLLEQAAELVLDAGAMDVLVADSPAKMRDAWAARSAFLEVIMEETKLLDECDVVVPVTKIASYLEVPLDMQVMEIFIFMSAPMTLQKKNLKSE